MDLASLLIKAFFDFNNLRNEHFMNRDEVI